LELYTTLSKKLTNGIGERTATLAEIQRRESNKTLSSHNKISFATKKEADDLFKS